MKVLIVVDPQNDFVHTQGKLSIANAGDVIDNINKLLISPKFDMKIITQDWHPQNHMSFAYTHGKEVFTLNEKMPAGDGYTVIDQMMWPNHCVANSWGAQIYKTINQYYVDMIIRKGVNIDRENYSFLEYVVGGGVDNFATTEYYNMFRTLQAEYFICGYATDYCVKQTAYSIRNHLDKEVTIITDAVKGVNEEESQKWLLQSWNKAAQWIKKTEEVI